MNADKEKIWKAWLSNTLKSEDNCLPPFILAVEAELLRHLNETGYPLVIGMCGRAGSGKDSALDFMKEAGLIHHTLAFAHPIKEIARLFGFTDEQIKDRRLKEIVGDFWEISPRVFMQKVGTEMFRNQWRPDVWVKLVQRQIRNWPDGWSTVDSAIFVTDVRFPNEAEMIRKEGGIIVRVKRDNNPTPTMQHPSEIHIEHLAADLDLVNDQDSSEHWTVYFTKRLTEYLHTRKYD